MNYRKPRIRHNSTLGKNEKYVLSLLTNAEEININEIKLPRKTQDCFYSKAHVKRVVFMLENKNFIARNKEAIKRLNIETRTFNTIKTRDSFYQDLLNLNIFTVIDNKILIEHKKDYLAISKENCLRNKSFEQLSNQNEKLFTRLYRSLIIKIFNLIEETKQKVFKWSNGLFNLIVNKDLFQIKSKNKVLEIYPNYFYEKKINKPSKENLKLIYEISFIFKKFIQDLDIGLEAIKQDYSNLLTNKQEEIILANEIASEKVCIKCKQNKNTSEFHKKGESGFEATCKNCVKNRRKEILNTKRGVTKTMQNNQDEKIEIRLKEFESNINKKVDSFLETILKKINVSNMQQNQINTSIENLEIKTESFNLFIKFNFNNQRGENEKFKI